MLIRKGDMWTIWQEADLFCITTNSYIRSDGALVMGRGIALQTKQRFPGVEFALGKRIRHLGLYGLLVSEKWPAAKLAAFQVKRHFAHAAELDIIRHSAAMLAEWAEAHPQAQVHLNFPGIGYGRLEYDQVLPIIETLPENVSIWMR